MEVMVERETMEFDVLIVGGGPAGLSAACRLMQMAQQEQRQLSVCVIEKGAEVGAHILSGALFEPRALNELFPDWQSLGAPLNTPVTQDELLLLRDGEKRGRSRRLLSLPQCITRVITSLAWGIFAAGWPARQKRWE